MNYWPQKDDAPFKKKKAESCWSSRLFELMMKSGRDLANGKTRVSLFHGIAASAAGVVVVFILSVEFHGIQENESTQSPFVSVRRQGKFIHFR